MSTKLEQFSLTLPLTLASGSKTLTEEALSSSSSSCIAFWRPPTSDGTENSTGQPSTQGVAIGCSDGSVFLLHASNVASPPPAPEPLSPPLSPRRYLGLSHSHIPSRSASPSPSARSPLSPFHVTRSRIVSSVTTEQAEAPKNYVDFEEEQERLKGMLRGKGHHRHSSHSRTRPELDTISISDKSVTTLGSIRRKNSHGHGQRPAALSPTSSTLSLSVSSPPSPGLPPSVSPEPQPPSSAFTLRCHFFPPRSAPARAVSALKLHGGGRYVSCLLETGALSVHSTTDGQCIASTTIDAKPTISNAAGKTQTVPPMHWMWRTLLVAASEESIILFACASPDEFYPAGLLADGVPGLENRSVVVAYELILPEEVGGGETSLEYLGQWTIDGHVDTLGLRAEHDHSLTLFHANAAGRLISRSLRVHEAPPLPADLPGSHSSTHLPLPNPFRALKSLSTDRITETSTDAGAEAAFARIELGAETDVGEIGAPGSVLGLRAHDSGETVRFCAWTAEEMLVHHWSGGGVDTAAVVPVAGVRDVRWVDHDSFTVLYESRAELYRVAAPSTATSDASLQIHLSQSAPFAPGDAAVLAPGAHVVSTHVKNGLRRVHLAALDELSTRSNADHVAKGTRTLWKARAPSLSDLKPQKRISCVLPLGLDEIVVGYSDGCVSRTSLSGLVQPTPAGSENPGRTGTAPLPGAIVALEAVPNARTGERVLVGGAEDGTIALWSLETLALCARWTVFTTPLARVVSLHDDGVGRLRGCVLCIAQDGTIAVVAVDECQFVYLVPGAAAPLARICLAENNMLLSYTDGRARLWDARTREFWRSMSLEKAEELMAEGGWFQWSMADSTEGHAALAPVMRRGSVDAASTLLLDVSALLRQLTASPALSGATTAMSTQAKLGHARAALSVLLTFGISEGIDGICTESLAIPTSPSSVGLDGADGAFSLFPVPTASSAWMISPEASADRALAILSMLQYLTQYEDLAHDANTVMTFYAASVGQLVHDSYQAPSLPRLGRHLLHTISPEVRHAARLLFDAGVARLSDQETIEMAESWQQHLPSLRPEKERDWTQSALALCVCGFIAVDKYTLLPTSILTDISKSIAVYLHDETSPHRSLAIDLCSRGFQVWQQYVDAVEMLRALFTLATTSKKEAIAAQNVGAQARTAVLQIAASNTPLFMTTLAIDILHPRSVAHRKAVLQLVVFLIRKKPLVLYANLPRLVEAIVKSLDPNASATRDAVLDSATEILSHVVQTFPAVDFHMGTQRLAVGTSEGAVVMYDLKTATRLYVLEGHKRRTTACSFSPDGRRLVTVSLEESDALVWKVGSSFTSFFLPGAPPRQGHAGSEPFKTLNFNIGDQAHMSLEETLVNVRFEWPTDRTVKLMIKESTMTFST